MDIMQVINTRYSTKEFDSTKSISPELLEQLKDLLQLSPSSTNLQPWHFVVASTEEGKQRIAKACHSIFSFNEGKVLDSSVVVVFASKIDLTDEYIRHVCEQEKTDGRLSDDDALERSFSSKKRFALMHKLDLKDYQHWTDKQAHINLGNFLLGVAMLGLDAIPMEGLDMKLLDEELGLREKGFTSSIVVSVGYHSEKDANKYLPKSRLPKEEIIDSI